MGVHPFFSNAILALIFYIYVLHFSFIHVYKTKERKFLNSFYVKKRVLSVYKNVGIIFLFLIMISMFCLYIETTYHIIEVQMT